MNFLFVEFVEVDITPKIIILFQLKINKQFLKISVY